MAVVQSPTGDDLFSPLLEDFLRPAAQRTAGLLRAPAADVLETEGEIRVLLELPGIRREEIEIGLENNVLSVSGEKRPEVGPEEERLAWHLSERRYGRFTRSFVLPRDVQADRIQARFADGVLTVVIPKSEQARRRRIEVQSGEGQSVH